MAHQAPTETGAVEQVAGEPVATASSAGSRTTVSTETVASMRRLVEPILIAVATSSGLYLVGSVYTDAYYGRMSIEATSLDLPPTYVGLQSMHVLQSLLSYPSQLLSLYVLYWLLSRVRWIRVGYERVRQRFPRVMLLLLNLYIVAPLALTAVQAIWERSVPSNTAVGEVSVLLSNVAFALLIYVVWLSFGPRASIITEVRQRKIIPIVLVGMAYLLGALSSTSYAGVEAAEVFMLGLADSSVAVEFTMRDELPDEVSPSALLLVAARNSTYFVVEQQAYPPALRPNAYMIPFGSVEYAHVRRVNDATLVVIDILDPELLGIATPAAP